jgi:heme exporter protein D
MSTAGWVWFAVGFGTLLLVAGLILGLIRQVKALAATVARFRQDVEPVLERLQTESMIAQSRADHLPERIPKRGPDARIRR